MENQKKKITKTVIQKIFPIFVTFFAHSEEEEEQDEESDDTETEIDENDSFDEEKISPRNSFNHHM